MDEEIDWPVGESESANDPSGAVGLPDLLGGPEDDSADDQGAKE